MAPKISVIIPVYNAENFIVRCVKSILMQDFKDLEIILVEDCSKDSSRLICLELEKEQNNIVVICQEKNSGAAAARNKGIRMAQGEFIMFVDSDDYWKGQVEIDRYIKILDSDKNLDFIISGLYTYYPTNNKYIKSITYPEIATLIDQPSMEKQKALLEKGCFPNSPCNKIIRKNFLINNHLFFPEGITAEDIYWYIYLTEKSSNFLCINDYYYVYDQGNDGSVTKQKGSKSLLYVVKTLSERYRDNCSEFAEIVLGYMAYEYILLLTDLEHYSKAEKAQILDHDWLRKYETNRKVKIANRFISIFGRKLTIKLMNLYKTKVRKIIYIA